MEVWVVIPVRRLKNAKSRLSKVLDERLRREFSVKMFLDVLDSVVSCGSVKRVLVVTPDTDVLKFSRSFGVETLFEEFEEGVNKAVFKALNHCVREEFLPIVILPSDVPLLQPEDLDRVVRMGCREPSVVISPSLRFDGTNLLFLNPPNILKTFYYEQNSFFSHLAECFRLGVKVSVYVSRRIMLDVDCYEDLAEFLRLGEGKNSYRFLREKGLKLLG